MSAAIHMWMTVDVAQRKSAASRAMTGSYCSCRPWRVDDIPAMLQAASTATSSGFAANATYAVVTDLVGGLEGVRRLPDREGSDETSRYERSKDLNAAYADILGEMSGPRPPIHVAHIVRCRPGRAVFGLEDNMWGWALSFALNLIDSYWGHVIVVTPYGWTCGPRHAAAQQPTIADLVSSEAVVPLRRARVSRLR